MPKTFMMKLDKIQPSQLYISSEKLSNVMKNFNANSIEPIPVKKLGGDIIFVDGHTRAFVAYLHGLKEIPVYWEYEEPDWEAYKICVEWCKKEGIYAIADLENRVISHREYEILWYRRCEEMQRNLEAKRKQNLGEGR